MTAPSLRELIAQARRDRPPAGTLAAVASYLRIPFVAAPLASLVTPSAATAALTTPAKAGLGRVAWMTLGGAVTAAGAASAVWVSQVEPVQAPRPHREVPPRSAPALATAVPAPPAPIATAIPPSVERRSVRESAPAWDEPRLIERARRALASEPRRALQLAQEHQRRFPSGALAVEREVIAIDALARSGERLEALRRARAFESSYPNSIHLPRVRSLRARLGDGS